MAMTDAMLIDELVRLSEGGKSWDKLIDEVSGICSHVQTERLKRGLERLRR